jgi:hypothetical protein
MDRDFLIEARHDINEMLAAMLRGEPLDRPPEFLELCDQAAARCEHREAEGVDIEAWAARLAEDLAKFTD